VPPFSLPQLGNSAKDAACPEAIYRTRARGVPLETLIKLESFSDPAPPGPEKKGKKEKHDVFETEVLQRRHEERAQYELVAQNSSGKGCETGGDAEGGRPLHRCPSKWAVCGLDSTGETT